MDTHELPTMRGPAAAGFSEADPRGAPPRAEDESASEAAPRQAIEALDFAVHTSVRYHAQRRAWFDRLHRLALGTIVLAASAAVGALYGGLVRAGIDLATVVAIAAALELFFAFSRRARNEDALYRSLNALATEIAEAERVDERTLRLWDKRRLLIRADAEEPLLVLNRICYNLEAEARGFADDALFAVTPWQRLAAHLVSLPPHRPRRLAA